jgi:hypothetical protein
VQQQRRHRRAEAGQVSAGWQLLCLLQRASQNTHGRTSQSKAWMRTFVPDSQKLGDIPQFPTPGAV